MWFGIESIYNYIYVYMCVCVFFLGVQKVWYGGVLNSKGMGLKNPILACRPVEAQQWKRYTLWQPNQTKLPIETHKIHKVFAPNHPHPWVQKLQFHLHMCHVLLALQQHRKELISSAETNTLGRIQTIETMSKATKVAKTMVCRDRFKPPRKRPRFRDPKKIPSGYLT